ncbi:FHA domain-containing protein [Candidatus Sumerlaeota bacterium]|nr:FHA domain-containing protein [Candidatus Sumerlaeota bacterium]
MSNMQLEIEVIGGPDKGRIFRISGAATIIGRDNECNIRLNDPTISGKHMRIELGNDSAQAVDLGSINKLQHNGNTVTKATLAQGDRIGIGDSVLEVTIRTTSPLDMQPSVRTGRRKGALLLVAASLALLMIFVYYGVQYQKEKVKQQVPVTIKTLRQIKTLGFRGLPLVYLPTEGDLSERATPQGWVGPKTNESSIPRPSFYSFQAPKAGQRGGYQSREELGKASVLPPDPFSSLIWSNRNWSNYNPRLGNGRLIKGEQPMVLGNYYVGMISYENTDLYNKTPEGLGGKSVGFDRKLDPERTSLRFNFYVEVWDSLPTNAPIQVVGLELKSPDMRYNSKPLVPKVLGMTVDRAKWTKSDINQQWADFTLSIGNIPYMHYMMRQEKRGESLAIFTGRDYAFQSERVDEAIRMLIEKQAMTDPTRKGETPESLTATALELEKEADRIIPDLLSKKMGEMDYYKEKWNYFRAFNRYHRALCLLQVADKWAYDDDYLRIFSKAEKIYDYTQSETGFFMQSWKEIERLRDMRDWKGVQKQNADLYQITTLGMEPELFPFLDEWFVYSHLVRSEAAKNIVSGN